MPLVGVGVTAGGCPDSVDSASVALLSTICPELAHTWKSFAVGVFLWCCGVSLILTDSQLQDERINADARAVRLTPVVTSAGSNRSQTAC